MTHPGFDEVERTLAAARKRLDALRALGSASAPRAAERQAERQDGRPDQPQGAATSRGAGEVAARGSGEAAGGRVRAAAVSGHSAAVIESVELEPRALRLDASELAGHVLEALNAAVDDVRANASAARGAPAGPGLDLAVLKQRLTDVQDQATRQLYQLTSALQDVLAKIGRDADVSGAVAVPDVEELFQAARVTLTSRSAQRGAGVPCVDRATGAGADGGDARGEGAAGPGGLVRAVAGQGGHVESLSIDAAGLRRGSHELAGYIVTAVNAALEELHRTQRGGIEAAAADRAELAGRVRAVQDLSLRQMRAFGDSLAALMASITPRS